MFKNLKNINLKGSSYRVRILACIAAAELITLCFFKFWPEQHEKSVSPDLVFSEEKLTLEDVAITRQESSPPPPPKPQVPIPVPNDKVIEEEIPVLEDLTIPSEYSDSLSTRIMGDRGNSDDAVTADPQTSPSVIRIVEPTIPSEAKKAGVKAEIWVSFLVDRSGNVEEANISQIRLFDSEADAFRSVQSIDYGLTEATLRAALQWKFRPAKNNGREVRAYTRHIFTYGF